MNFRILGIGLVVFLLIARQSQTFAATTQESNYSKLVAVFLQHGGAYHGLTSNLQPCEVTSLETADNLPPSIVSIYIAVDAGGAYESVTLAPLSARQSLGQDRYTNVLRYSMDKRTFLFEERYHNTGYSQNRYVDHSLSVLKISRAENGDLSSVDISVKNYTAGGKPTPGEDGGNASCFGLVRAVP